MSALRETPLEIKVIFELGDATHAEVTLDEPDARDLLAYLQRDGFVSNDSTVGQVADALKYVLEPEPLHETETPPTYEPRAGYVIRGPYSDGTFCAFERNDDGAQRFIGSADDYETARDLVT